LQLIKFVSEGTSIFPFFVVELQWYFICAVFFAGIIFLLKTGTDINESYLIAVDILQENLALFSRLDAEARRSTADHSNEGGDVHVIALNALVIAVIGYWKGNNSIKLMGVSITFIKRILIRILSAAGSVTLGGELYASLRQATVFRASGSDGSSAVQIIVVVPFCIVVIVALLQVLLKRASVKRRLEMTRLVQESCAMQSLKAMLRGKKIFQEQAVKDVNVDVDPLMDPLIPLLGGRSDRHILSKKASQHHKQSSSGVEEMMETDLVQLRKRSTKEVSLADMHFTEEELELALIAAGNDVDEAERILQALADGSEVVHIDIDNGNRGELFPGLTISGEEEGEGVVGSINPMHLAADQAVDLKDNFKKVV
jgi:hypothetical protein